MKKLEIWPLVRTRDAFFQGKHFQTDSDITNRFAVQTPPLAWTMSAK
jgi:hypothetical protein